MIWSLVLNLDALHFLYKSLNENVTATTQTCSYEIPFNILQNYFLHLQSNTIFFFNI